jgi:carbon storage regulator
MLIVQRRVGERIMLGDSIEITVASVTKRGVRLALRVPSGVTVLRGEVVDAIVAANAASATSSIEEPEADTEPDLEAVRAACGDGR